MAYRVVCVNNPLLYKDPTGHGNDRAFHLEGTLRLGIERGISEPIALRIARGSFSVDQGLSSAVFFWAQSHHLNTSLSQSMTLFDSRAIDAMDLFQKSWDTLKAGDEARAAFIFGEGLHPGTQDMPIHYAYEFKIPFRFGAAYSMHLPWPVGAADDPRKNFIGHGIAKDMSSSMLQCWFNATVQGDTGLSFPQAYSNMLSSYNYMYEYNSPAYPGESGWSSTWCAPSQPQGGPSTAWCPPESNPGSYGWNSYDPRFDGYW